MAYTFFKNTVSHIPTLTKLLPVDTAAIAEEEKEGESSVDKLTLMNFEPEEEVAVGLLVPKYMTSILYGAFVEAVASEMVRVCRRWSLRTNNGRRRIIRRTWH